MSIGFKKSLLGFNCSDVINYIDRTHKTFLEKEENLNAKVSSLNKELSEARALQEQLSTEKAELESKLDEFNQKYAEIERLSENIGKLYLVAQTNSQAIMENSENNAKIASEEVNKNLYSISEAHRSLKELRASIAKTSNDFIAEVDVLMQSLNTAREKIAVNTEKIIESKNDFSKVYNSVIK